MKRSMSAVLATLTATGVVASAAALYDLAGQLFSPTVSARHESAATLQRASATATEGQHAYVTVDLPETSVTQSGSASIEVVVRPDTLSKGEPYIILVYAKATHGEQEVAEYDDFLGSFSWHIPPQLGQPSTFYVNAPDNPNATDDEHSMDIQIRLEPVEGDGPLRHSRLTVLRATLVP